jgi:hypothetical protein
MGRRHVGDDQADLHPQWLRRTVRAHVAVREQLHGAQVLCAPVDQRRLGAPHRMRAVVGWIEAEFLNPAFVDPGVLPRPQMR